MPASNALRVRVDLSKNKQKRRLMRQQQRRLAAMILLLQLGRRIQQQTQLLIAQVLRLDVVFAFQIRHRLLTFQPKI